jgi:hypothetical protein
VLFLMELFLIGGDVYYVFADDFSYHFIYVRLFFIACSTYNLIAVIYVMNKYSLWSLSYQGDIVECESVDWEDDVALTLIYRPRVHSGQSEAPELLLDKDPVEIRIDRANTV